MPDAIKQCVSILVVEDDAGIRESLRLILEVENYAVTTAADGKEGLQKLATMPKPCLILVDLMMPVMNGWEFVKALEGNMLLASIPVVIVTAYADSAKTIRASGIVKKPVNLDELLSFVRQHCGPSG